MQNKKKKIIDQINGNIRSYGRRILVAYMERIEFWFTDFEQLNNKRMNFRVEHENDLTKFFSWVRKFANSLALGKFTELKVQQ